VHKKSKNKTLLIFLDVNMLASKMEKLGIAKRDAEQQVFICMDSKGNQIELRKESVEKIPYLNGLLLGGFAALKSTPDGALLLPEEINVNYLKPVLCYADTGDSLYLISKLRKENQLDKLLELVDFLGIGPEIPSLMQITIDLKNDIKDYTERIARKTYDHHTANHGRRTARSAAAEFIVGFALDEFDVSDHKIRQTLYNTCVFIHSHHWAFRPRCRTHLWRLMKEKCTWFTIKQWKAFDAWVDASEAFEDDETDHSLSSDDHQPAYDSDDYCGWNSD